MDLDTQVAATRPVVSAPLQTIERSPLRGAAQAFTPGLRKTVPPAARRRFMSPPLECCLEVKQKNDQPEMISLFLEMPNRFSQPDLPLTGASSLAIQDKRRLTVMSVPDARSSGVLVLACQYRSALQRKVQSTLSIGSLYSVR